MKKTLFVIFAVIVIILVALSIVMILSDQGQKQPAALPSVCFQNTCFRVELADTDAKRTKGLMDRSVLPQDQGMLFVFDRDEKYSFWMKNTLIPLDIIWIGQNHRVVFISENTLPCKIENCPSVAPPEPARFVLELNAGTAQKIGLKTGGILMF
jgi:uncharacterized membrane protein (UPF0127 family)